MITKPHTLKAIVQAGMLAFFAVPFAAHGASSPIRINEIMYDPPQQTSGANLAWVELYNQSSSPVTIMGGAGQGSWTIQDQYGTHYFAAQPFTGSMTIPQDGYGILADDPQAFIRAYPFFQGTLINAPIALPLTQGTILIKNSQGSVLTQASWNQSQGAAGNGKTLEYSSKDNAFREGLRIGGSPGLENSVEGVLLPPLTPSPNPATQPPQPTASPLQNAQEDGLFPVIDEVYSNPLANQSPWIELKNDTNQPIDLGGWILRIESQQNPIALNGIMAPGSLMLVSGSGWGFSMNPQADTIEIVDPRKIIVFKVSYTSALPQGWSANRIANGSWQASSKPTPGTPNIIKVPSPQPASVPVSEIIPPVGANAYEPSAPATTNRFSDPSLVALGFALGAGIAGVLAFAIVKKRFLY